MKGGNPAQLVKSLAKRALGPKYLIDREVRRELESGEPELALLPLLCERSKAFLDIGANQGVYSRYAMKHAGAVYAVEANPPLARHLDSALGSGVRIFPVALSDEPGSAILSIPVRQGTDIHTRGSLQSDANPGFEIKEVAVEKTTVDRLGLSDIGVVKVDVEGHEFAVLKGALETLRRDRPVVIIECEERHNEGGVARLFALFDELGYQPYFLHRGRLRPGSEYDIATFQSTENASVISGDNRPADYVNNFLFFHPSNDAALRRLKRHYV